MVMFIFSCCLNFVILIFACRRQATFIPGSYFHVHLLVCCSCDVELVVGAVLAVNFTSFVVFRSIEGQMVSASDIVHVVD